MTRKPAPKPDDPEQSKRFLEIAEQASDVIKSLGMHKRPASHRPHNAFDHLLGWRPKSQRRCRASKVFSAGLNLDQMAMRPPPEALDNFGLPRRARAETL